MHLLRYAANSRFSDPEFFKFKLGTKTCIVEMYRSKFPGSFQYQNLINILQFQVIYEIGIKVKVCKVRIIFLDQAKTTRF